MEMNLDFSDFYKALNEMEEAKEAATPPEAENPPISREDMTRTERMEAAELKSLNVYKRFQAGIKLSERATSEILKGTLRGENPYKLLEQACAVIGALTDDGGVMAQQIAQNIKSVYGAGALEPPALEIEIAEIETRLQLLQRPELEQTETPDSLRRIQAAIREHKKRLSYLQDVKRKNAEKVSCNRTV